LDLEFALNLRSHPSDVRKAFELQLGELLTTSDASAVSLRALEIFTKNSDLQSRVLSMLEQLDRQRKDAEKAQLNAQLLDEIQDLS